MSVCLKIIDDVKDSVILCYFNYIILNDLVLDCFGGKFDYVVFIVICGICVFDNINMFNWKMMFKFSFQFIILFDGGVNVNFDQVGCYGFV